jgi:pimeloyl-ACP methyl ester carboxylesterase
MGLAAVAGGQTLSTHSTVEHRGCRLAYAVRGDGPPVVFIQGTGLHGGGWQPQVNELAAQYRCLTFDNRGMAASQPPGAPITVEQMAEDTLALMDAEGWDSAHLVGHSLGGLIALHLALSARARVRSLSLLCTFARGRDATQLSWGMFWLGLRTYLGTRRMRRRAFTEMVLPPNLPADRDAWAERLAPLFGHDLADHPPVVMKQLAAIRAYDATPQLGKLAGLPTLVVGAGHDRIARPEVVRALAAGIPGSRLVEFPDAAHGVTIQCAGEINALLHEHLSRAKLDEH